MKIFKKKFLFGLSLLCFNSLVFGNETILQEDQWDGRQYLNNSELQYQWATTYVKKLKLEGTENVLDIGCGDGRITAAIAHSVPYGNVLGIDTSDSMLSVAEDLKNKIRLKNLEFTKCDATKMSFINEFDYVVSFSCLHWIHDHFSLLQGIEKALKPNGKVFLYFAADHGEDRIDHAINAVVNTSKWSNYFSAFTPPHYIISPSQFSSYAQHVGLAIERIDNITIDEIFPSKNAFLIWMSAWLPHLKVLPHEFHQEFLEEITNIYFDKHPMDGNFNWHYIGYWVEVELIKNIRSII